MWTLQVVVRKWSLFIILWNEFCRCNCFHWLPKDEYIFAVSFRKMNAFWKPSSEYNNKLKLPLTCTLQHLDCVASAVIITILYLMNAAFNLVILYIIIIWELLSLFAKGCISFKLIEPSQVCQCLSWKTYICCKKQNLKSEAKTAYTLCNLLNNTTTVRLKNKTLMDANCLWRKTPCWIHLMPGNVGINFTIRKVNLMFVFILVVWTFSFNKYMIQNPVFFVYNVTMLVLFTQLSCHRRPKLTSREKAND